MLTTSLAGRRRIKELGAVSHRPASREPITCTSAPRQGCCSQTLPRAATSKAPHACFPRSHRFPDCPGHCWQCRPGVRAVKHLRLASVSSASCRQPGAPTCGHQAHGDRTRQHGQARPHTRASRQGQQHLRLTCFASTGCSQSGTFTGRHQAHGDRTRRHGQARPHTHASRQRQQHFRLACFASTGRGQSGASSCGHHGSCTLSGRQARNPSFGGAAFN